MRCEELLRKVKDVTKLLDEIDEMIKSQAEELSKVDTELSDWYHLIENNDLNKDQSFKVVKRIHDLRIVRRDLKNENELEKTFSTHKNKLIGTDTRQFLNTEMNKKRKSLDTQYNNRVITQEEIEEVMSSLEHKKRGRPKKKVD